MTARKAAPKTTNWRHCKAHGDGDDYMAEEIAFGTAMDRYQREHHRPYPTWSEVLAVAESLGYRLVAEPRPLPIAKRRAKLPVSGRVGDGRECPGPSDGAARAAGSAGQEQEQEQT